MTKCCTAKKISSMKNSSFSLTTICWQEGPCKATTEVSIAVRIAGKLSFICLQV